MQEKQKIYIIFGPTAVGKSDLISYLSEKHKISFISADSTQVYKRLDIGSAKPSSEELGHYRHYMIDIKEPYDNFSVGEFVERCQNAIVESLQDNLVPIISGGTAFYIKSFLYGLSNIPATDSRIRIKVEQDYKNFGIEYLYSELEKCDPVSFSRINKNDAYRIKRAVEVYRQTGMPLSSFHLPNKERNDYEFVKIGLLRSRESLRERIRLRLDYMFENGLVDEVESLKKEGLSLENQSMQAIGYREFFCSSDKNIQEIKEKIFIDTVHYAKRQNTFFNSFKNVNWIDRDNKNNLRELSHIIV